MCEFRQFMGSILEGKRRYPSANLQPSPFWTQHIMTKILNFILLAGLGTVLLNSSSAAKEAKKPAEYLFFPPPPDEPHIQFLASFSTEEQLQELAGKRKFFNFIVGEERMQRPIVKPYGITSTPGRLYVCDTGPGSIEIIDLEKRRISYFRPGGNGTIGTPINIAVDDDGTRYITDTKRKQVLIYKVEDYAGAIGEKDDMKPVGVALAGGRIYVTDIQNHCVRVYDKTSLKELFRFPKTDVKEQSEERLYSPTNVALGKNGKVYVSDTGGFSVNVYDSEGKFLKKIGEEGLSPGKFGLPKGIAVDRKGLFYVVDAKTQLVQLFDDQGRILMYFGNPTSDKGGSTCLPAGIAVDYDNVQQFQRFAAPNFAIEYLILLTNQMGGQRVSVFGFGHKK
jgi:DNA-binding beta-propeller fold protein YncE